MLNKLYIIHIVMLLAYINSNAQVVPGYMGKRLLVMYNAAIFPSIALGGGIIGPDYQVTNNKLLLNYRHNLYAEYVLSRSVSMGLSYDFIKTKSRIVLSPDDVSTGTVNKIYAGAPGIFLKHYHYNKSGSIAPVGYYDKFALFDYNISSSGTYTLRTGKQYDFNFSKYHAMAMSYEYGKQAIFKNRYFINIGSEIGILFTAHPNYTFQPTWQEEVFTATASRVFNAFFINFKIGTGILLY